MAQVPPAYTFKKKYLKIGISKSFQFNLSTVESNTSAFHFNYRDNQEFVFLCVPLTYT